MVHLLQFFANKGQDVLKHSQIENSDIQVSTQYP